MANASTRAKTSIAPLDKPAKMANVSPTTVTTSAAPAENGAKKAPAPLTHVQVCLVTPTHSAGTESASHLVPKSSAKPTKHAKMVPVSPTPVPASIAHKARHVQMARVSTINARAKIVDPANDAFPMTVHAKMTPASA
jgi:hypothetical protein